MNMKAARKKLGLTLSQSAELHRMTSHGCRRWELKPDDSGYRQPSGSAMAFTQALLDGYRPGQPMQAKETMRESLIMAPYRRAALPA